MLLVNGSSVSANTSRSGGGIFNRATLTVMNGSTIGGINAGNQGLFGGGIHNLASGTTTIDDSTISANTASDGGGIYNRATLTITNGSTIGGTGVGNQARGSATDGLGGGIYNGPGGTMTVEGSTMGSNTAKNGGGIYNHNVLNVDNSIIGGFGGANRATIFGGGIYNAGSIAVVTGSCILNNWATIDGGGLYNDADKHWATYVAGSSIVGNSATSFFNNQSNVQNAIGNWWGAATGPNTPGADTVGGPVDTSDYMTEPIPSCLYRVYLPLVLGKMP